MNFFLQYGYISTLLNFKADAQYQKKFRFDEILDEVLKQNRQQYRKIANMFSFIG